MIALNLIRHRRVLIGQVADHAVFDFDTTVVGEHHCWPMLYLFAARIIIFALNSPAPSAEQICGYLPECLWYHVVPSIQLSLATGIDEQNTA